MKKTVRHLCLGLFIVITLFLPGCDVVPGFESSSSSGRDFSQVDSTIAGFVDEIEAVEGASIVIVTKASGVVHKKAFGNHTLDTIVLLASTSKVPSAGILMSLADDGLIDIDTPIDTYTDWGNSKPGITLAHLLSNTSGLPGLSSHGFPYMPHVCQYLPQAILSECTESIYRQEIGDDLNPPGTLFQYGGSQWHLAGGLAEAVSGQSWAELVQERLADPCDLSVFRYGNQLMSPGTWTGNPDDLMGLSNPNMEAGAISNLDDYAKILMMHLNGGVCGEERVLSQEAIDEMRTDRGTAVGGPAYGFGWWITLPEDDTDPSLFYDPGAYGAVAWIDLECGYGAYFALETSSEDGMELYSRVRPEAENALACQN